jgi:hypothetical protein
MRSDTDTKFILTIIAVCLIWIAAGGPSLIPGVQAQGDGVTRVRIVGWDDSIRPPRVTIAAGRMRAPPAGTCRCRSRWFRSRNAAGVGRRMA